MNVLVHTANFGSFDELIPYAPQKLLPGWQADAAIFSEASLLPRAMGPRLQARLAKMWAWELRPDYDAYLWVDASCSLLHEQSVSWFLRQLKGYDCVFFKHPDRRSIREEAEFIRRKVQEGSKYLVDRYYGEDIDGQLRAVTASGFTDTRLYASTVMAYFPTDRMKALMREWWLHTTRYHLVDQLALPYLLWKYECEVNVPDVRLYECPYVTHTRNHTFRKGHA